MMRVETVRLFEQLFEVIDKYGFDYSFESGEIDRFARNMAHIMVLDKEERKEVIRFMNDLSDHYFGKAGVA